MTPAEILTDALECMTTAHEELRKVAVAARRHEADDENFREAYFELLHSHANIADHLERLAEADAFARAAGDQGKGAS